MVEAQLKQIQGLTMYNFNGKIIVTAYELYKEPCKVAYGYRSQDV